MCNLVKNYQRNMPFWTRDISENTNSNVNNRQNKCIYIYKINRPAAAQHYLLFCILLANSTFNKQKHTGNWKARSAKGNKKYSQQELEKMGTLILMGKYGIFFYLPNINLVSTQRFQTNIYALRVVWSCQAKIMSTLSLDSNTIHTTRPFFTFCQNQMCHFVLYLTA